MISVGQMLGSESILDLVNVCLTPEVHAENQHCTGKKWWFQVPAREVEFCPA